MDLRIENVVKLMRKRLVNTTEDKFDKYKEIIGRRIRRKDRSFNRRSNRLWFEISTGNTNFNISKKIKRFIKNTEKKDMLKFFDDIFTKNLSKLSIQEFSNKIKSLPKTSPIVKGRYAMLIKRTDLFRKRNIYLR